MVSIVTFAAPLSHHGHESKELVIGVPRAYCISRDFAFTTSPERWKDKFTELNS